MPHILCAGLITVDFTFETDGFPVEGNKHQARTSHMMPGGGALLAASAIAQLGGRVDLKGCVGDDALGAHVQETLCARGIGTDHLQTIAGTGTARSAVIVSDAGERTIINHRAQALFPETPDIQFYHDAALVDTRWPGAAVRILRAARMAGKLGVIDAESPVRLCHEALPLASHIIFSEQGLSDYAGACDAAALSDVARELGVWVAVTRGPRSVLCHDGETLTQVLPCKVDAVDTLGAGDVWHGAFTLALARGETAVVAAKFGNAAAAAKVTMRGGRMPDQTDVAPFLDF